MYVILQLAAYRREGIADCSINVRCGGIDVFPLGSWRLLFADRLRLQGWLVGHDEFFSGYGELDSDVESMPVFVMPVGCFDHYAATRDPVEKFVEFVRFFLDASSDRFGGIHVPERYLCG